MLIYKKINDLVHSHTKGIDAERKITKEQLASKIGITKLTLDNIANGKSTPGADTLEKIALYFKKDMNYFFDSFETQSKSTHEEVINDVHVLELSPEWFWNRYDDLVIKLKEAEEKAAYYERKYGSIAAEPTQLIRKNK